jgi:hypothetical protein
MVWAIHGEPFDVGMRREHHRRHSTSPSSHTCCRAPVKYDKRSGLKEKKLETKAAEAKAQAAELPEKKRGLHDFIYTGSIPKTSFQISIFIAHCLTCGGVNSYSRLGPVRR